VYLTNGRAIARVTDSNVLVVMIFFHSARGLFDVNWLRMCTLEDLQSSFMEAVGRRDGVLLNGPFTDLKKRYRLRCSHGHE
jgi:hypothetical protein